MKNTINFDCIISNPPFSIGNKVVKSVIDNVEFNNFINLMPISKYKANKLYQHILPETIIHSTSTEAFNGAFTTPICAELTKDIQSDCLYEEFEVRVIFDQRLSKFWDEQLKRDPTYIKHKNMVSYKDFKNISSKTSFSCGIYTPNVMLSNGPKTLKNKDGSFKTDDRHYIWNFMKPIGGLDDYFEPTNNGANISQTVTIFSTEQEADNFKNWAHSGELTGKGRLQGLFSILLRAMNKPTACPFPYAIPRVDWKRPWTDEQILEDYGYTKEEIDTILHFNDDLKKNK